MSESLPEFMFSWAFLLLMLLLLLVGLFLLPRPLAIVLVIVLVVIFFALFYVGRRAASKTSTSPAENRLLGKDSPQEGQGVTPAYRTLSRDRAEDLLNRLRGQAQPSALRELLPELENLVRELAEAGHTDVSTRRMAAAVDRLADLLTGEPGDADLRQARDDLASALKAWLELGPGGRYRQAA